MENEQIKVSVIVPIYNVSNFLNKCIDSICGQTHANLEIILVDDGSVDNSGKICDEYSASANRIKVIHKQNAGVSAARNTGLEVATGEYICFVDGDDYVMPDYVSYLLDLALKYNVDISLTTEMFSNFETRQIKNDNVKVCSGEEATEGILCYRIPIGVYCKIFKRSFLGDNMRFLPQLFIGEGFHFNTAAFQRVIKVAIGHRRIYYYRRDNPTSATTKFSINKCINGILALEKIKEEFVIKSEKLNTAWNYANWRTHSDFYDLMVLASVEKEYPDIYIKCYHITKKEAMNAFSVPTSWCDRARALIMRVYPKLIPQLMLLRRLRFNLKIEN